MSVNNAAAADGVHSGAILIDDTLFRLKNCLSLVDPQVNQPHGFNFLQAASHDEPSKPEENTHFTVTEVTITAEITNANKSSTAQASSAQPKTPEQTIAKKVEPKKASDLNDDDSQVVIESFKDETQMPEIMRMITNDLSEPYSIYTYRYFIHNWPDLCLLVGFRG